MVVYPTPVLLPGKSHGRRSLVGCSPWVAKSWTPLSDFTFTFHFHALEKEMTTHSSVFARRIPGTGVPGGLLSMGTQSRTQLKQLSSSSSSSDSAVNNPPANAGNADLIPGLGRSPGEGHGNLLGILAWKILLDRVAWRAIVLGVSKSRT